MSSKMNLSSMEEAATDVSNLLKLLSNRNRLLILCQLIDGEKSVGELARSLNVSQVIVSQQLGLLKNTRMVENRREAQTIFYSIINKDVTKLVSFLYKNFCPQ